MPPRRSFLLEEPAGKLLAWELWRYSRATGVSPRQALRDPDLGFGLTVMRGYDQRRRERFESVMTSVAKKDDFGLNRLFQALRLIFEDN